MLYILAGGCLSPLIFLCGIMKYSRDNDITKLIKTELLKILSEMESDIELLDITFRRERDGRMLRIVLDKPNESPTLDDCAEVSRKISAYLDADESIIPYDKYNLEVSTPGIDRPLSSPEHFRRYVGRKCKVVTKDKDESGRKNYTGVIESAGENTFNLYIEKENAKFELLYTNVKKANLEIEF